MHNKLFKDIPTTDLEKDLIEHEGVIPHAYTDSNGFITIGVGRNIDKRGGNYLSAGEIIYLLRNDIEKCREDLNIFEFFYKQKSLVQDALLEMCFNMGLPKLLTFKKMIRALMDKDFKRAVSEAEDSLWARQVGSRRVTAIVNKLKG